MGGYTAQARPIPLCGRPIFSDAETPRSPDQHSIRTDPGGLLGQLGGRTAHGGARPRHANYGYDSATKSGQNLSEVANCRKTAAPHSSRWGLGRPTLLRVPCLGGYPGGAGVDHGPAQARRLPGGLQRVRSRKGRPLRRPQAERASAGPAHLTLPVALLLLPGGARACTVVGGVVGGCRGGSGVRAWSSIEGETHPHESAFFVVHQLGLCAVEFAHGLAQYGPSPSPLFHEAHFEHEVCQRLVS